MDETKNDIQKRFGQVMRMGEERIPKKMQHIDNRNYKGCTTDKGELGRSRRKQEVVWRAILHSKFSYLYVVLRKFLYIKTNCKISC